MNFFTAMTLVLISFKAFSLPVITESNHLFRDHKDPRQMYFMPQRGGLALYADGKPQFDVFYYNGRKASGLLTAIFELKLPHGFSQDEQLSVMPVLSSYYKMGSDKIASFFEVYELPSIGGLPGASVGFSAILNPQGNSKLQDYLKNTSGKINLFKACYELSGVSPVMQGEFLLSESRVSKHFQNHIKNKTGFTHEEILKEVQNLFFKSEIAINIHGGDAHENDYLRVITQKLIKTFFYRMEGTRLYQVARSLDLPNLKTRNKLIGRYSVQKEVCIDMDLDGIQNFPELFSK